MCRFLLSAASIFFVLTATLLPSRTLAASRCTVKMPVTLLSLYRESDFIYIGQYDKLEEGELINETDDYREVSINKHFSISSALKGETRKLITLTDSEYRYKVAKVAPEPEPAPDEHAPGTDTEQGDEDAGDSEAVESEVTEEVETDEEESNDEVRPGDSVLLFMKKDEDSDELVLSDYIDGLKKMTPDKLAAYEVRIRELNGIFGGQKPSYSLVVAWLVRCAEDPYTRWEGTYELLRSFQMMEYEAEQAKAPAADEEADESAEPSDHADEAGAGKRSEFETGDPRFAKNLSEGEKLILTDLLLKRNRADVPIDSERGSSLSHGDRELIELVKRWGDVKVAASLLEDLRAASTDTDLSSELMPTIASILGDGDLLSISADYTSIRWEDDDAEVDSDESESAKAEETVGSGASESGPETEVIQVSSDDGPAESAAKEADKPGDAGPAIKKKTHRELRKELVDRFIIRAGKLLAPEAKDEVEK